MLLQISILSKRFSTKVAFKRALPRVPPHVLIETSFVLERLSAFVTKVLDLAGVFRLMSFQITGGFKTRLTLVTLMRPVRVVSEHVPREEIPHFKLLFTARHGAGKPSKCVHGIFVIRQRARPIEHSVALPTRIGFISFSVLVKGHNVRCQSLFMSKSLLAVNTRQQLLASVNHFNVCF